MKTLTVINPFGGHAAGDAITDPAEVEAVLAGENAHSVVTVDRPDPEPAAGEPAAGKPAKKE